MATEIKMRIDKNISFPTKRTSTKRGQCKYEFSKMELEDSFVVSEKKRYSVSTLAKRYGDQQNPVREFTVRRDARGILRCLRVK